MIAATRLSRCLTVQDQIVLRVVQRRLQERFGVAYTNHSEQDKHRKVVILIIVKTIMACLSSSTYPLFFAGFRGENETSGRLLIRMCFLGRLHAALVSFEDMECQSAHKVISGRANDMRQTLFWDLWTAPICLPILITIYICRHYQAAGNNSPPTSKPDSFVPPSIH